MCDEKNCPLARDFTDTRALLNNAAVSQGPDASGRLGPVAYVVLFTCLIQTLQYFEMVYECVQSYPSRRGFNIDKVGTPSQRKSFAKTNYF